MRPTPSTSPAALRPPSLTHWLGTDALGPRCAHTRHLSARASRWRSASWWCWSARVARHAASAPSPPMRAAGPKKSLMRATDLVFCFPPIILAMAIAAALGIGTRNTVIAMLVVWWPKFARLARSLVIGQRSLEYVEAAQAIGFGPAHILFRQIIPNAVGPLVVLVTLDLGNAILVFAGLSFLGLGVVPPTPEWGSMVSEGRELVDAMVGRDLPRPRHPDRRDRLQLRGRRHPRLARSACTTTLSRCCGSPTCAPGSSPTPAWCARSMASASRCSRGETLGIVGESGSGKSVAAKSIMRLLEEPARIVGGIDPLPRPDMTTLSEAELREIRGAEIAMVFQDPMTSLNPVLRIARQLIETMTAHGRFTTDAARDARRRRCCGRMGIAGAGAGARIHGRISSPAACASA